LLGQFYRTIETTVQIATTISVLHLVLASFFHHFIYKLLLAVFGTEDAYIT